MDEPEAQKIEEQTVTPTPAQNLLRWEQSGSPREWVDHRHGHWTHADWEVLLSTLQESEFWPMDLEAIGVLLEKLKQTAPAKDTACPECGEPDPTEMAGRGVEVTLFRALATFPCHRCQTPQKVDFTFIDKAEGVDVRCSCGAIAHVPPSVWCQTCGKGMSTGWQNRILNKR